jgi:16S rRNA (cytosine967-C5)-methyltransferase
VEVSICFNLLLHKGYSLFSMHVTGNLTRQISLARRTAFEVLESVASGGYASDLLRDCARDLSGRDAGLAAQIVFGCLRYQRQLDYLIFHYSGRNSSDLDLAVILALRVALFQLRYLERVPAHAAVHQSVEFVKWRKRAAANFTNAVLRKVNRKAVAWPDTGTELSCPDWLLERWSSHFDAETALRIASAALNEPESYVRISPGSSLPAGVQIEETAVMGAYRLLSGAPPAFRLHDIGSQAIVPLLDLRPGDTYLDLCAAPGNKTVQALETPLALAVACDISARRIADIPPVCPRVLLDATAPLPFAQPFRRIFIDAPCSGTGTLARNPEIKWRLRQSDLTRFHQKQSAILARAIPLLAPGGKLVYATCSLEREENEDVVAEQLQSHSGLRCTRERWRLPGREPGDGFYAAVLERS